MNYKRKVLIVIIIIKVLTFIWFLSQGGINIIEGFWGRCITEIWYGYLQGMENFVTNFSYDPDLRMPGYGMVYLIPRLLTNVPTACNIVIIIQLLTAIVSTYLLAEIALKIFKTKTSFILTAIIFSLNFCISSYEVKLYSDSLSISFSIIAFYFFMKYFEKAKYYHILISAILICWAIFIRPVMGVMWGVMGIYLLISAIKNKSGKTFVAIVLFAAPFIICDSLWVIRNYIKHKEISPFDSMKLYKADFNNTRTDLLYPYIFRFVSSWGGNPVMWDPESETRWFGIEKRVIDGSEAYFKLGEYQKDLPEYIYTSKFNNDSLLILRSKIQMIWSNTLSQEEELEYCDFVNTRLLKYTQSIREEKPFIYYVYSPLRIAKTFLFTHGTQNLIDKKFVEMNFFEKSVKIMASCINIFTVLFGLMGIIMIIIKRNSEKILYIPVAFSLLYIFYICFIFKFPEIRYLLPLYAYLMIPAIYTILLIDKLFRKSIVRPKN